MIICSLASQTLTPYDEFQYEYDVLSVMVGAVISIFKIGSQTITQSSEIKGGSDYNYSLLFFQV